MLDSIAIYLRQNYFQFHSLNIISLSKFVLWQLHFVCWGGKRKLVGSGNSSSCGYCCIKCIERSEFLIFLMEFILPRYIYTLETIMLFFLSEQKRNMYFAQTHIRGNSIIITIIILRLLQLLSSFGENAKVFMRIFLLLKVILETKTCLFLDRINFINRGLKNLFKRLISILYTYIHKE